MSDGMIKKIIVGNWKMYKTAQEAVSFVKELLPLLKSADVPYLAVPFTAIHEVVEASESKVIVGAQNMNDAQEGAFTGEIAAKMLLDIGAKFVILGHSERRHYFHEDNGFINRKVKRALMDGLQPILCIGETQIEREEEKTNEVIQKELLECLAGLNNEEAAKIILSYEPIWAIGTNLSATTEQAQEVHAMCRKWLEEKFTSEVAHKIPILYGGSVTPKNAKELMSQPDVDGVLVGGASLNPVMFSQIINRDIS